MRHAAGHFPPCGFFLGLEQLAEIFEHNHVTEPLVAMLYGRDGNAGIDLVLFCRNFKLRRRDGHAVCPAKQMFQVISCFLGEDVSQARPYRRPSVGPEHSSESYVAVSHTAVWSQ